MPAALSLTGLFRSSASLDPRSAEAVYVKCTIGAAVFFATLHIGYFLVSGWPSWSLPSLDITGFAFGHDFLNFWMGATTMFSGGPVAWFDYPVYNQALQQILGPDFTEHFWSYPPHLLLFIWPFGLLPYFLSFLLWSVAGVAAFLLACRSTIRDDRLLFLAVAPAATICVVIGQNGFFTAALLIGGLSLMDRRPILAGILFGCLTVKPQLGLLLPVMLLLTGRWRVIAAAVVTTLALVALTALWFGIDIWIEFVRKILPQQRWLMEEGDGLILIMVSSALYSVRLLRLPLEWAWAAQYLVTALALAATVWTYRRPRDPVLSIALLMTASLLFTPYALMYDMVVLAWVVALLRERGDNTRLDHRLGLLVWMLPVLMLLVSGVTRWPFAIFVLLAFAGRLLWRLQRSGQTVSLLTDADDGDGCQQQAVRV